MLRRLRLLDRGPGSSVHLVKARALLAAKGTSAAGAGRLHDRSRLPGSGPASSETKGAHSNFKGIPSQPARVATRRAANLIVAAPKLRRPPFSPALFLI